MECSSVTEGKSLGERLVPPRERGVFNPSQPENEDRRGSFPHAKMKKWKGGELEVSNTMDVKARKLLEAQARASRPPEKAVTVNDYYQEKNDKPAPLERAPRGLAGPAKEIWHKLASMLVEAELLKESDRLMLRTLCEQYSLYAQAQKTLKKEGLTFATVNGYIQQRPEVAIGQTALKNFTLLAVHFGLTPKSRKAILVELEEEKEGDPMDAFLKKRGR